MKAWHGRQYVNRGGHKIIAWSAKPLHFKVVVLIKVLRTLCAAY